MEEQVQQPANVFPDSSETPQAPASVFPADVSALTTTPNDFNSPQLLDRKSLVTGTAISPDQDQVSPSIDKSRNLIELGQERNVSEDIANQQFTQDRNTQKDVMRAAIENNDNDTFVPVFNAYNAKQAPTETDIQTAIPRQATSNLISDSINSDPVNAKVINDNADQFNSIQEHEIKNELLRQALVESESNYSSESRGWKALDWFSMLMNPASTFEGKVGNVELPGDSNPNATGIRIPSQARQEAERARLMAAPLDQFVNDLLPKFKENLRNNSGIFGYNPLIEKQRLQEELRGSPVGTETNNIGDFVLNTVGGIQIGGDITRLALSFGNRGGQAELTASKLLTEGTGKDSLQRFTDPNTAIENGLNSGQTNITDFVKGTNAPTAVSNAVDRFNAATERLNRIQADKTLTAPEQQVAIANAKAEIRDRIAPKGLDLADVQMAADDNTKSTTLIAKIGKKDGAGWSRPQNAIASLARAGYDVSGITASEENPALVKGLITPAEAQETAGLNIKQDIDGRYYAQIRHTVDGTGVIEPAKIGELQGGGILSRSKKYLLNTNSTDLADLAMLKSGAVAQESFLDSQVYHPVIKSLRSLNNSDKKTLDAIGRMTRDTGQKDLNYDELASAWKQQTGKDITPKQATGYYAAKHLSNLNWALENKALRADLAGKGFKTINFKDKINDVADEFGTMNGRFVNSLPQGSNAAPRVYDVTNNRVLPVGSLSQADLNIYKERGLDLIEFYKQPLVDNGPVSHMLINRGDYTFGEMPSQVLNYAEGTIGSRMYRYTKFVKQAVVHDFGEGGSWRGDDITHFTGRTEAELSDVTERYNRSIEAYNNYKANLISKSEAEDVIGLGTDWETTEEMDRAIEKGTLSTEPFHIVNDGERPNLGSKVQGEFSTPQGISDTTNFYYRQGRTVFSPRGEILRGPQDEVADTLNIFSSLSKGAANAIRSTAFSAYKDRAITKFFQTAKSFDALRADVSPLSAIQETNPYNKGIDAATKSKLETMRWSIQRMLRSGTTTGEVYRSTAQMLGKWMEGSKSVEIPFTDGKQLTVVPESVGNYLAGKIYDAQSRNPLAAIRGYSFSSKLGFFNPAQLVVQSQTLFNAMAAHPVFGTQTMSAMPAVRLALFNDSPELLDYLSKLPSMTGMKPLEFKTYMNELKNSGVGNITRNLSMMHQDADAYVASARTLPGVQFFKEYGNMFFNESELWNRLTAHGISYRKAGKLFDDVTTPEARTWIKYSTDQLSSSMQSNSKAFWQQGILGFATQFQAYTERQWSMMAPAFLGGSSYFTAPQKMRMVLGNLALYGKYGVPLGPEIWNSVNDNFNLNLTQSEYQNITGGVMDSFLRNVLGLDSSIAKRSGAGSNLTDFIDAIQDNGVLPTAMGPVGSMLSGLSKQVYETMRFMTNADTKVVSAGKYAEEVGAQIKQIGINNISTLSNFSKARYIWNNGDYISNSGKVLANANDLGIQKRDLMESLSVMLSVPPQQVVDAGELYKHNQATEDDMKQIVNAAGPIWIKHVEALNNGDYKEADTQLDNFNILMNTITNNQHDKILLKYQIMKQLSPATSFYGAQVRKSLKLEGRTDLNGLKLNEENK